MSDVEKAAVRDEIAAIDELLACGLVADAHEKVRRMVVGLGGKPTKPRQPLRRDRR